jgi:hypothetical protein
MPENPYQSPSAANQPSDVVTPVVVGEGDALSTIIPYKNKAALIAYYSGVFSLSACIPLLGVVGVVLAVVAMYYGSKGLRYAQENPAARGRVHCWIGLICGGLFGLTGMFMQAMTILSVISALLHNPNP